MSGLRAPARTAIPTYDRATSTTLAATSIPRVASCSTPSRVRMATSAASPASILAISALVGAKSMASVVPAISSKRAASAGIAPCTASVENMRRDVAMSPPQEIEVAAVGRLQHGLAEQLVVAAQACIGRGSSIAARRFASSASSTSRSSRRSLTLSRIWSPVRTSASGPPAAASGATCSTMVP